MDISDEDKKKVEQLANTIGDLKDRLTKMAPNIGSTVDTIKLKSLIKVMYSLKADWPEEITKQVEDILD